MTNALSAFGTKLQIGDGEEEEEFTDIAEITRLRGPNLAGETVEVTSHSSADAWKEYIPTILSAGDVTADLNYVPSDTNHQALITALMGRTKTNFNIITPGTSNTTWAFSAYVAAFNIEENVNGALTAAITLRVTGKPTVS